MAFKSIVDLLVLILVLVGGVESQCGCQCQQQCPPQPPPPMCGGPDVHHREVLHDYQQQQQEEVAAQGWALIEEIILPKSIAFIQVDNELKYLVDGVAIHMDEIIKTGDSEMRYGDIIDDKGVPTKNYIIFDPPHLDFKEHPTGMPLMKKVVVQNNSPDMSVQLHSLSGNTLHFHCTFFTDKVVSPGGNTTFDVVFLGREEGLIENTIFIHTSVGTFKYGVRAVGTSNPYRLRPLVGVRMPLNSSYSPLIQLHNPHPRPLQITEMYSTGGDLHLELLSGSQEAHKNIWNIPPYHTRALMRANFVARRENNHTSYVRIVTSEVESDYLVVPVEVEVSGTAGLYCPQDGLHFGLHTPQDSPTSLPLYLLNSAHKHIHIQNVITTPVNDAISIDFKPIKIPPGTVRPTQVATVTFNPSKVSHGKKVSGKLLIKSKVSAYKLSVPFTVDLLQGELIYNSSITKFYTGTDPGEGDVESETGSSIRNLTLTNTFPSPVVIYNLTLPEEAEKHFEVGWDGPVVVGEGLSAQVATLRLLSVGTNDRIFTQVTVHTNITTIQIPLMAYNGKLTKYVPPMGGDNWLDFGTLGMGEQRDIFFYVINENPVELRLRGWGSNLTRSAVELMGVEEGNITTIRSRNNMSYVSKSYGTSNSESLGMELFQKLFLKPNHYAVFRIGVLTPDTEGIFRAESFVQTQYEQIKIPFRLRTADGSLSVVPNTIIFKNAFPGKISHQDLHILSTFGHPMTVKDVRPQPLDQRFWYESSVGGGGAPLLRPGHQSQVGRLVFDPMAHCHSECYAGFSLTAKGGQQWVNTLSLTSHVVDTDTSLYSTLQSRYQNVSQSVFNTSLVLQTSEVHGFYFTAQASLKWPRLTSMGHIEFSLTQVLNTSIQEVEIENPASVPVVAQILLLHNYPSPQQLLNILKLPDGVSLLGEDGSVSSSSEVFSLVDIEHLGSGGNGPSARGVVAPSPEITSGLAQHKRILEGQFKTRVAKDSIAIILEPGIKVNVRLSFTPPDEKFHSTVLLIRNNLTVIDALLVQGRGGRGFLKFGNRKPGSATPLQFNIGEKHLKDCDNGKSSKYYQPNFTVKRSFTARNTGELPVHVWGFNINDQPCEGYGFKVLNCQGFELSPNSSHKVDIAFTPDFTLSKVQQRLVIHTSLGHVEGSDSVARLSSGNVEYSLVATVPSNLLAGCGAAVPRPNWEPLLYYGLITVMVAMLVGVVVLAALEADHILKSTFIAMTTTIPGPNHNIPAFDKSKVFDLRPMNHHESKNMLTQRNGYINGHTHVENLKSYQNCNNNSNKKSSSSVLNILSNAGRSYSGSNNSSNNSNTTNVSSNNINNNNNNHNNNNSTNRKGNNQVTNSSTKQKLQKQNSDPKYSQNSKDTSGNTESNNVNQSRKSRNKSNKKNESSFLANILASVVGSSQHSVLRERKTSQSSGHNDSGIERLSVATETDMHIDDNFNKALKKRSKQCNEEETSSTTTESSNTDELSISERDISSHKSSGITSSGNNGVGKCKKKGSKGKSSNNNRNSNIHSSKLTYGGHENDPAFDVSNTTKGKGDRKKKDTSSRTNYGDIYQPSTLELPYTLKPLRNKELDREKENRRNSKNKSIKNNESSESIGSGRSSPPSPSWDESQRSGIENLSDLGSQNFSNYKRSQVQPQPLAPRESYSAILLGADKQKAKITPFAKIPPEKRIEKPLGAIGQKIGNTNLGMNGPGGFSGVPCSIANLNHTNSLFSNLETLNHVAKEEAFARSLYNNGYNDNNALPTAPSVSTHSWDPQTLSAPPMSRHPPPGLSRHDHPIRRHSTLSEEDWNRNNYLWEGKGYGQNDQVTMSGLHPSQMSGVAPTPPSPGLWDSLPSLWYPSFRGNTTNPPHSAPPVNNNIPMNSSPWGANFTYEQQAIAQASQMAVAPHENTGGSPPKGLWFDPLRSHGSIWASDNFWSPTAAIPKKDI